MSPVEWAVCTMGDLEGVSDVLRILERVHWRRLGEGRTLNGGRGYRLIKTNTEENIDEWDGQNGTISIGLNHANLYKINRD
jgi:hypothetical protein